MAASKIVMFELNECPWRVILDHVHRRPHGALASMLRNSDAYETHAEDRTLSPWITWSTLHRGVDDRTHGVINLNQELSSCDREHPTVWSLLRRAGLQVGVFGSMHSHPLPVDPQGVAFHVPDPFATDAATVPASVRPFQEFNLAMSRQSARNVSTALPWSSALGLAVALPRLGVRPQTLAAIAGQLVDERRARWKSARRRTYQAVLGFDVFMRLLERRGPDVATFFTNHVAATMHRFWAAAYPGDYAAYGYDDAWRRRYADEIAWSMDAVDDMLARLLQWAGRDGTREVWLTTSMGQAATRADNRVSTQLYLTDVAALMSACGFAAGEFVEQPAMLPRVVVAIDPDRGAAFERRAGAVEFGAGVRLGVEAQGPGRYCLAVPVLQDHRDDHAMLDGRRVPLSRLGFSNTAIEDESGQTAYHVPEGALIVHRRGARSVATAPLRRVSTLDVAPMLLTRLGVAVPAYMRAESVRRWVALGPAHASAASAVRPRPLFARPNPPRREPVAPTRLPVVPSGP
jgi:hypothetical protein